MPQDVSMLEGDLSTNRSEELFILVKEHGAAINKEQLEFEQFFARNMPFGKRAADIVGAILSLICLSPLMLAMAIAIKLTSKGPIFFIQERTGQNLRRFRMYKFRTMEDGAHEKLDEVRYLNVMNGPLTKMDCDPRLAKIGRFMRKTSLDELPQLFNVLKGDMTIIGPRALSPLPSEYESWQRRRFTVKPGLACTWQAEMREGTDFVEWMRSDLSYVDKASFWKDLRLLFKTLWIVVTCRGGR